MDTTFIIAISTMGGLGFLFASALALADKKLRVEENPQIARVNETLPNANCGACGCAGCYDFAIKVVEGKIDVSKCTVGGQEVLDEVASILGIEAGSSVKMVARVLCRGGNEEAAFKQNTAYSGPQNCAVQALVSGGNKLCLDGCLGGGDCVDACQFNAMYMNENGLPVVIDELCTGCGLCVKACPRGVIEIHPADRLVFVFCKNHDDPKTARKICKAACIGCQICARKSDGGIVMIDNLAVIDYDRLEISKIPLDKCTTKAIDLYNHVEEHTAKEQIN